MHADSVAQPLITQETPDTALEAPWPDVARHSLKDADHELVLVYRGVTERETRAVGFGRASFALVVEPPLIMLCYRFGDAIPWSLAPYRWHRIRPVERFASSRELQGAGAKANVRVSLVEAESERLRVCRVAPLSIALTRAWNAAIRRHVGKSCTEARFSAALAQFSRRYPHPESLLTHAIATSVDGE
ncbi:MAG TPA: hypothetical protein VGZ22_14345 [Isosphaeraceae bacterium]|jgi:hypothetical protein|nr:hypothetical protein [Isosphaeraceae bacterium]